MPFREVKGSVLSGAYSAIAVETVLLPYPNVPKPKLIAIEKPCEKELSRVKAVGINGAVGAAEGWRSVQMQLYKSENIPQNTVLHTPGFFPVTPEFIHIIRSGNDSENNAISELKGVYQKIMDCAEENGINYIAVPVIGASDPSELRRFRHIAEDFFVTYFMTTNSPIKVDLFISDTAGKFKTEQGLTVISDISCQERYICRVFDELKKKSGTLYKIFPTIEKLGHIMYNHKFKPRDDLFDPSKPRRAGSPAPEVFETYEKAAKKLEKTLPKSIDPKQNSVRSEKSAQSGTENNSAFPISETAALELAKKYEKRLAEELEDYNKKHEPAKMSEAEYRISKSTDYIHKYFASHDCTYGKLAEKIGLGKSLIANISSNRAETFCSSARAIAVAALLELEPYDFWVFAVTTDPDHTFPDKPEDILAWKFVCSGIRGFDGLEKELTDVSAKFSLKKRVQISRRIMGKAQIDKRIERDRGLTR